MEEIRLGTLNIDNSEQHMNIGESISKSLFEEIKNNTSNLYSFNTQEELYAMFIINFLEFNNLFKNTVEKLLRNQGAMFKKHKELEFLPRNANRLFLNFLSSARTLIDHTETYLTRKYGKESYEFKKFKTKTKELFDSSFEYRFMYKLRNYAQHCGLPITNITYTITKDETPQKNRKIILSPLFDKNDLLEKYKEWGSLVKNDFKNLPDELSVRAIINEYYKTVEILNKVFLEIERSSLTKSINFIEDFQNKYYTQVSAMELKLCIFHNFKLDKPNSLENSEFKTFELPTELIEKVKQKLQPTR